MRPLHMLGLTALAFCTLSACSPPSDPVLLGQLCYPDTPPCPRTTQIDRGTTLGRNVLDFRVTNDGADTTRAFVRVAQPTFSSTNDARAIDASFDPTGAPSADVLASREFDLATAQSRTDRFVGSELGRDPDLIVEVFCDTPACNVTLDYVLVVESIECVVSQDCSSGWLCDDEAGQCVECLAGRDDQCAEGQTCELGRCTPPQDTGCSSAPAAPGRNLPALPLLFVALFALCRARPRARYALAATLLAVALTTTPGLAHAQQQGDAMRAEFSFGAGPRFFTGDVGERTDPGAGFYVAQELRWRYVGLAFTLDTAFFVTRPDALPLGRDLGTYSVRLGPRGYLPLNDWLELFAGAEYERMGLAANSLATLTGTRISYDAVTMSAGARARMSSLFARVGPSYHLVFGFPGDLVSIDLTVGLTGF